MPLPVHACRTLTLQACPDFNRYFCACLPDCLWKCAGPSGDVLVDHARSAIQITRRDMACMAPLQWLNDEVINLYISLLLERDAARRKEVWRGGAAGRRVYWITPCQSLLPVLHSLDVCVQCAAAAGLPLSHCRAVQGKGPRCHFFSTFFANKLYKDGGYNYEQVWAG